MTFSPEHALLLIFTIIRGRRRRSDFGSGRLARGTCTQTRQRFFLHSVMSYPPPIYPPIPTNTAWTVAFLEDTYGRPIANVSVPEAIIVDEEMFTESSALTTNDASTTANRLQQAQSDTAWPIVSPLAYSTGQCSMFATRSSPGTYISLGDTRFRNTTENNHNSSALAIEPSHSVPSVPIPAQVEMQFAS